MKRVMQTTIIIIFTSVMFLIVSTFASLYMSMFRSKFDKNPPTVPQGLYCTGDTAESIFLTWKQSKDGIGETGVKEYVIYLIDGDTIEEAGRIGVGEFSTVQYEVQGLTSKTTYNIRVSSVDFAGNESSLSEMITDKTDRWNDDTPPSIPGKISFEVSEEISVTSDSVDLKWGESIDEQSGIWCYAIYLNYSDQDPWQTTEGDETNITLIGLESGKDYNIHLKARNKAYTDDTKWFHESDERTFSFTTKP